jgi:hypothetical protein
MSFDSIFRVLLIGFLMVASGNFASADGISIKGKVVDGVTGKPITIFVEQGGRVDPKDPKKVEWGYFETRTEAEIADGAYRLNINWNEGWRVRILANGYLPQPVILEAPPKDAKELEVTVRMVRGREVMGTILDHTGKPVADASVFLVGKLPVSIRGGKAMRSYDEIEDKAVTRAKTIAEGRYAIMGAGEDVERMAISTPGLDLWVVALPANPSATCDVRLPEPCRLTIKYNIAGSAAEGEFFLQMLTHEDKGWLGIDNIHKPKIANGGSATLTNLAPGPYTITRTKNVRVGNMGFGVMLDRQGILLKPGGAAEAIFVREKGAAITGKVEMEDREKYEGAMISVRPADDAKDLFGPKFDCVKMEPDGSFRTERILPGEYVIEVQAYAPEPPQAQRFTGLRGPDLAGSIKVTVPAEGEMKPVTITLKKPDAK